MIYERLARPALFRLWDDPEDAHDFTMRGLRKAGANPVLRAALSAVANFKDSRLEQSLWGLNFPNPVGMAGGMDKNGVAVPAFEAMGFGFLEIGTLTRHAQPGNPPPRVFRFPEDEALINRFGFNNIGAEAVAQALKNSRYERRTPLGISLGKSKVTPLEEAVEDYLSSFRTLHAYGDYFAINVSSPNTPGLRQLQDKAALEALLLALMGEGEQLTAQQNRSRKPILVKIAPDLEPAALAELLEVCASRGVDGLIATNTTLSRDGLNTATGVTGGLSGKPLFPRSLAMVRHIRRLMPDIPIIGVGGIMSPQDAWEMMTAGANLIQIYTGLIYHGPLFVRQLNRGILSAMDVGALKSVADIGKKQAVTIQRGAAN